MKQQGIVIVMGNTKTDIGVVSPAQREGEEDEAFARELRELFPVNPETGMIDMIGGTALLPILSPDSKDSNKAE